MSEAVKDLIQQAMDQDFNNANKTFQDVMTIKMSDLLDQEKVRLADQIYNGIEPENEEDLDLEDEVDAEEELEDEEAVQESDPDDEESMGDEGSDGSAHEEESDEEDSEES